MKYYKWIFITIMIFLIVLSILFVLNEGIKDYAIGDINGDDKKYLIILTGSPWKEYGRNLIIFSLEDKIKELERKDFTQLNPWKLLIGDIDGDGKDEISIGVYKESPFHQVMAKRPFIYSFIDGDIQPKWRGSRLSRPFTDYNFFDIDGDGIDEIVAIEILQDNRKIINAYKWKGFGFEGYLESEDFDDIKKLEIKNNQIYIHVKQGKDCYKGFLKTEDNILKIERVD